MKHANFDDHPFAEDRFGARLASHLSESADSLSHDLSERLRVARQQALNRHKLALAPAPLSQINGAATLTLGHGRSGWWQRIAAFAPLLLLAAGLILLHIMENEHRARELAELDQAILTDDLPPAAYTDPGFLQFLKVQRDSSPNPQ